MTYEHENILNCHETHKLMALYISNDPTLSQKKRAAFEQHILSCTSCASEYEGDKHLEVLLRESRIITLGKQQQDRPVTMKEGWERLKRSCPSLAEACRRNEQNQKLRKFVWRVAGLAVACVIIAMGVGFLAWQSGSNPLCSDVAANRNGSPAAYAELVTAKGRELLALNQPITTGDQPCEILLGGMHRVVMNADTKATFSDNSTQTEKNANDETLVYNIQLARGELYVEVVSGHPFTVNTTNSRLDITGTKFDVRAENDRTDLTLLKGSVRFSRCLAANGLQGKEAFVNVTAGHMASVVGQAIPTTPRKTDALATTAWARDLALNNAVATAYPEENLHLLESVQGYFPRSQMLDLDSIDYVQWREEHREWFQREFPWIFKAADALKQHQGLDADYIELLMVSGDIWQFHYPRAINQPIPAFNAASIQQIAAYYALDPTMLLAAIVPANVDVNEQPLAQAAEEYQNVMRNWQSAIASLRRTKNNGAATEKRNSDVLFFSLRAGTYLSNTRTAAWMWAQTHPAEATKLLVTWQQFGLLPAESQTLSLQDWLNKLRREIATSDDIGQLASEILTAPQPIACDSQGELLKREFAELSAKFMPSEEQK